MPYGLSNEKALEMVAQRTSPQVMHPERAEWVRRIYRNAAFLSGIQRFWQNPLTGRLEFSPRPTPNKQEFTANLILPYTMRAVSKLVSFNAEFACAPNSDSREDRWAAKIGDKVFQHEREQTRFRDKVMRAQVWGALCGLGSLKITWNPDKGEAERVYLLTKAELQAMGYPPSAQEPVVPVSNEDRQMREQQGAYIDVSPGDIDIQVDNPFGLYWDWDAKEAKFEGLTWLTQVSLIEIDKIKEQWGSRATTDLAPDENAHEDTLFEESAAVFYGGIAALGRQGRPRTAKSTRCRVTETFEVPSKANGYEGRHLVTAGTKVLKHDRNDYAAAGMPIPRVFFGWYPRPGSFVDIDLVGQITDPQRAYNRSAAHGMEVEATNGYPTMVIPKNSGIKSMRIASFPGNVLEMNMNGAPPPFMLPMANLPPYIAENREVRRREIQEITGQADPIQGKAPGQVRGTGGVEALIGQGEQVMTSVLQQHVDGVARAGRMILALYGMFANDRRTIKIMGEGNQYDVTTFSGADLRGNYDVRVVTTLNGEGGKDPAQRVMQLAQAGLIDMQDPELRKLVLDAFHLKSPSLLLDSLLLDQKNAEDENAAFVKLDEALAQAPGVPDESMDFPIAADFEDHACHIATHNRLRKSIEYRKMSPQGKKLVDAHVMQHQGYAMAIMQAQQSMAPSQPQEPQGGPGASAKGKPSPPRARAPAGDNS